jgi:hypothetical protein
MDNKKETKQTYRIAFRSLRTKDFEEDGLLFKRFMLRITKKPVSSFSISPKGVIECKDLGYYSIPAKSKTNVVEFPVGKKEFESDNYLELFIFSDEQEMEKIIVDGTEKAQPILALIYLCLGERALDHEVVKDTQELTLEYDEEEYERSIKNGSKFRISYSSKCGMSSPILRNESAFPEVELFPKGTKPLKDSFDKYFDIEESARKRVDIALRWFHKALKEKVTEDKFLALWISFEALTMEGQTDVAKGKKFLAKMLNIPLSDVDSNLEIGRMFGHRGDLVHGSVLDPQLSKIYCSKLLDVVEETLRWRIGIQSQNKLKKYLQRKKSQSDCS